MDNRSSLSEWQVWLPFVEVAANSQLASLMLRSGCAGSGYETVSAVASSLQPLLTEVQTRRDIEGAVKHARQSFQQLDPACRREVESVVALLSPVSRVNISYWVTPLWHLGHRPHLWTTQPELSTEVIDDVSHHIKSELPRDLFRDRFAQWRSVARNLTEPQGQWLASALQDLAANRLLLNISARVSGDDWDKLGLWLTQQASWMGYPPPESFGVTWPPAKR